HRRAFRLNVASHHQCLRTFHGGKTTWDASTPPAQQVACSRSRKECARCNTKKEAAGLSPGFSPPRTQRTQRKTKANKRKALGAMQLTEPVPHGVYSWMVMAGSRLSLCALCVLGGEESGVACCYTRRNCKALRKGAFLELIVLRVCVPTPG